ncbi:unnamed protein product [Meloidogyne enterolobii]|uniref:Uncharacterized protein n=1 Tax=Meloidogyne enterolobii TaxID=390850 RepID=A0ACB1AJ27_MELEN
MPAVSATAIREVMDHHCLTGQYLGWDDEKGFANNANSRRFCSLKFYFLSLKNVWAIKLSLLKLSLLLFISFVDYR